MTRTLTVIPHEPALSKPFGHVIFLQQCGMAHARAARYLMIGAMRFGNPIDTRLAIKSQQMSAEYYRAARQAMGVE